MFVAAKTDTIMGQFETESSAVRSSLGISESIVKLGLRKAGNCWF